MPCHTRVNTDPRLLRRSLQNLLANAVRYTERGRILLGCRRVAGAIRIEVWDTGIGIVPESMESIFKEFHRDAGPATADGGLGLGLAITRKTTELIGGKIALSSKAGLGSCFSVLLPVASEPKPQEIQRAAWRAMDIHVAIVGTDDARSDELRQIVARWIANCETFASMDPQLLKPERFDLLLFTEADSFRTTMALLGNPPDINIAVISTGDIPDGEAGAYDNVEILTYPVKRATLRRYLNAIALRRNPTGRVT